MPLATQLTPQTAGLEQKQVLVVGFRKPIIEVLERLRIPFAVWHDRPIKRDLNCLKSLTEIFPSKSVGGSGNCRTAVCKFGPFFRCDRRHRSLRLRRLCLSSDVGSAKIERFYCAPLQ